jgi:hypothetical protein
MVSILLARGDIRRWLRGRTATALFHVFFSAHSRLARASRPTLHGEVIMTPESSSNCSRFAFRLLTVLLVLVAASTSAWAQSSPWNQSNPRPRGVTDTVDMTGPRFGITMLNQQSIDTLLEKKGVTVQPMISQFGWQFEHRLYTNGDGITVLTEWIPLISGLDQGVALPSLNWLTGLRSAGGSEFGIGPNITPLGVGLVVAAGVTMKTGALHVPFNVAVATSKSGVRLSFLTGFNVRRR